MGGFEPSQPPRPRSTTVVYNEPIPFGIHATRHYVTTNDLDVDSGFVHVPYSHEQVARREDDAPSMSYDAMKRGLRAMAEEVAKTS